MISFCTLKPHFLYPSIKGHGLAILNKAAMTMRVDTSLISWFQVFWLYTHKWLLYGNSVFNVLRNCCTVFLLKLHHFTFPPANSVPGFQFLHILVDTSYLLFCFDIICLNTSEVISHCGFYLHFPHC